MQLFSVDAFTEEKKSPQKLLITGPQLFFVRPGCRPNVPETETLHQPLMQDWVFILGPSSEDATHYLSNMCPTAHTKIYGETERWAQDFQLDKTNEGQTLFMSYISHRNINCFILPSFIKSANLQDIMLGC